VVRFAFALPITAITRSEETGAGCTWAEAHPFSFSLKAVVLEFDIPSKLRYPGVI